MNDSAQALPGVLAFAGLLLFATAFLVPALRLARRWIPEREAAAARWELREVLWVVLLTLFATFVLGLMVGDAPLAPLLLTEAGQGIGVLWLVQRARARAGGLASLGLGPRASGLAYLGGPLVFLPLFPFLLGVGGLWAHLAQSLGWSNQQQVMELVKGLAGADLVVAAVLAVVVAPFLEELLFRGFLQGVLSARYGARAGLLVTSAVFALLHGLAGLPVLFALALFLGWLQQRSRCLWLPWSVHALNNGVVLALAFWQPSSYPP